MSVRARYCNSRRRRPTSSSRPRRLWWSCLCVFRCSVKPRMRSVSMATCTSGEPVSRSTVAYSVISRDFTALSSGTCLLRGLVRAPGRGHRSVRAHRRRNPAYVDSSNPLPRSARVALRQRHASAPGQRVATIDIRRVPPAVCPNASVTSTRGAHQPAKETCAARQRCEVPTDDRVRDGRARHRFARGAGRHADGAHPGLDRAPEDAQARPPQSPRPAAARWPASSAVAVPGPDRHQPLPVTDRATRPAPVANQTTAAGRHAPTAPPEPGPLGARGGRYGFRSSVVAPGGRGFPPSPGRFHRRPARSSAPRRAPGPSSEETSLPDTHELPGAITTTATIDNGAAGTREVRFETGRLARQAAGAAVAYLGDSMVLAATTASKNPKEQLDFFPLTVDVEERMYAAGRIPGSFFRREGRPSEDAILTCRLIDRPLRPSFGKGLRNEIQVVCTIMALDPDMLYDVVAINAASAATMLAGLPFSGPIGATRMGYVEGAWVAFPTHAELERATFDMVVAGRVLDE